MGQLWWIVGIGMAPFIISVIYSTTHCGAKKIAWGLDVIAVIIALATFFLAQSKTELPLFHHLGALGVIASCVIGYIAMAIVLPLVYVILYAMPTAAPKHAVAEAAGHGHGHGDHGHGHGHDAHGGHGHDAHGGGGGGHGHH